jgi:hypothetical protein
LLPNLPEFSYIEAAERCNRDAFKFTRVGCMRQDRRLKIIIDTPDGRLAKAATYLTC